MHNIINDKLLETKSRAAKLYLQRQNIEIQLQQLNLTKLQVEQAMISTDGELKVLEELSLELQGLEKDNG